jgi:hypothetical protein
MSETLRRYDAEFGHLSAQCIDQHRALPARRPRARYGINTDCSVAFTGTNRIEGRLTASQIASASAASFLLRLT